MLERPPAARLVGPSPAAREPPETPDALPATHRPPFAGSIFNKISTKVQDLENPMHFEKAPQASRLSLPLPIEPRSASSRRRRPVGRIPRRFEQMAGLVESSLWEISPR